MNSICKDFQPSVGEHLIEFYNNLCQCYSMQWLMMLARLLRDW